MQTEYRGSAQHATACLPNAGAPPGIFGPMKKFDIGPKYQRPQGPCATAVSTYQGSNPPIKNLLFYIVGSLASCQI